MPCSPTAIDMAVYGRSPWLSTSVSLSQQGLHENRMLTEEELACTENHLADYLETMASLAGQPMTFEAARTHTEVYRLVDTASKLVVLSEQIASNAAFVRQMRRKFGVGDSSKQV